METLANIKALAQSGRRAEAKGLCQAFLAEHPDSEAALMQLLVLDPTPAEEVAILQQLLLHFPTHRFAARFQERLDEMRVVSLLNEREVEAASSGGLHGAGTQTGQRLGEYLVARGLITPDQLAAALASQQRQPMGTAPRLGILLVLNGVLTAAQLAEALTKQNRGGFGEFGDYLIRRGVVTPVQLQQALARQVQLTVEVERRFQQATARHSPRSWLRRAVSSEPPQREAVPRLGEVLVEQKFLSPAQLQVLLQERERTFNALFQE